MTEGRGDLTRRLLMKDDNDNVLTGAWNSYVVSSPKIQSYHCLLNVCSYKSAPTQHFRPGSLGGSTGVHYYLSFRLLSYGKTPSYPNKRVVHSFKLPYVALL